MPQRGFICMNRIEIEMEYCPGCHTHDSVIIVGFEEEALWYACNDCGEDFSVSHVATLQQFSAENLFDETEGVLIPLFPTLHR